VKDFYCLDEREVWHAAALRAAQNHGYNGRRVFRGEEVTSSGVGFIRPHVAPATLLRNHRDYEQMATHLTMIQDERQVKLYEDKSSQFKQWGHWMPDTWRFTRLDEAMEFLNSWSQFPLVSKADVGASSVNVRILINKRDAERHLRMLFGNGVVVEHSCEVPKSIQKDYALLQRFIPHKVTWRVNAIGDARAVFKRFCYRNRPVAQTGNVEPVMVMDEEIESLLEYSNKFFVEANTKWCAIDVLKEGDSWKLLETSLAWPWPSPGRCNEAPIFGSERKWIGMFEVMMDQVEQGAWAN
jgi:hypothetical protein